MKTEDYITQEMIISLLEEFGDRIMGVSLTCSVGNGKVKHLSDYANVSVTGYNNFVLKQADLTML